MAVGPSATAGTSFNVPPNVPMAVRGGSPITTECFDVMETSAEKTRGNDALLTG